VNGLQCIDEHVDAILATASVEQHFWNMTIGQMSYILACRSSNDHCVMDARSGQPVAVCAHWCIFNGFS
jgi:hypothetical protein